MDGIGQPIDGLGAIESESRTRVEVKAPVFLEIGTITSTNRIKSS